MKEVIGPNPVVLKAQEILGENDSVTLSPEEVQQKFAVTFSDVQIDPGEVYNFFAPIKSELNAARIVVLVTQDENDNTFVKISKIK